MVTWDDNEYVDKMKVYILTCLAVKEQYMRVLVILPTMSVHELVGSKGFYY